MLNKNNIKISVIVPCYNIESYLPRCIESILAQTYKNLEVILISDGSTDGTDEVIREYAKKIQGLFLYSNRIQVFLIQETEA